MYKINLKFVFLLISIFAFAFILRIYNLTILPVFADEAIYIRWSQVMGSEPTLRFLPLSDGKQPLFMWILMFLVKRFSDPLWIGRALSVVSGTGTILVIGLVSMYLTRSKKVSLAATLFYAISPFSVFFDRMALVDSMLMFFGSLTFLLGAITAKTKRFDFAMLTGFSLGFALLTKSPALFFVILLPSLWFLFPTKNYKREIPKLVLLTFITYTIGYGMYNILRLGPNFQLISSRNADYVHPLGHVLKSPLDPLQPHFSRSIEWLSLWGTEATLFLFVLGLIYIAKKDIRKAIVLSAWAVFPILVNSEFAKVFTARYILFTLPFIFIIAAHSVLLKTKLLKYSVYTLIIFFICRSLWIDNLLLTDPQNAPMPRSERSGYLEEWTSGIGIKEVSQILKEEHLKDPNKQIVVGTEGFFGTLPDGLQIYMQGVPNVVIIGVGLDIGDVHASLKASKKAGNKTYLVANSSRLKFRKPFEEYGLKVIASYQKADRPEGIREYFHYGLHDTFYLLEVESLPLEK